MAPLPRTRNDAPDVSTEILTKISDTPAKQLTAAQASAWLVELDESINSIKKRIHDRIHENLPAFERQLSSAKSVQERLQTLTTNIDELDDSLKKPEKGLVPKLLGALKIHADITRESARARLTYRSLEHLSACRNTFNALSGVVDEGRLEEAVSSCHDMEELLIKSPPPLDKAIVLTDLKNQFRALKDRTEEQLSDAYSRSIAVLPTELIINSLVQVRLSSHSITLPSILGSLTNASLASHLMSLRRDLTAHYIIHVLQQPTSITLTSPPHEETSHHLNLFPSPPNTEDRTQRLANLSTVITFLATHLFPALPPPQNTLFPQSLARPVADAVLEHLLVPSLPSRQADLSLFLELVRKAVAFEAEVVEGVLSPEHKDGRIRAWADSVGAHYERKRRVDVLQRARRVILSNGTETFSFEVVVEPEVPKGEVAADVDAAWDLQDGDSTQDDGATGWGFEDEAAKESPVPAPQPTTPEANGHAHEPAASEDPGAAWGWDDGQEPEPVEQDAEGDAWDDPWGDNATAEDSSAPLPPQPKLAPLLNPSANKGTANGAAHGHPPGSAPAKSLTAPVKVKETYRVSERARQVLDLVKETLSEAHALATSNVFSSTSESANPGAVLLQSTTAVLDLYRALYSVRFSPGALATEPSMQLVNDASYLCAEVGHLVARDTGAEADRAKLAECAEKMKALEKICYDDVLEQQEQAVYDALAVTDGFAGLDDQENFDSCEIAISGVLRNIRSIANRWKPIMLKSKYYSAIGTVVDAALSRMLDDILAFDDIPDVESHRLAELCRILKALESLFVDDQDQSPFAIAYVPSWLKFEYLTELLEASMADISYLFQEGALVDFEIDELVKLVRALFADTQLRTNTILKLQAGHPASPT